MYKTMNGIDNLNKAIQEIFNPKSPKKKEIAVGEVIYREHDKILQLTNMPDENVFNALTSNGTMYGCFTAVNNKLYINAAYIRAGTISSDITVTGKLVADNAVITGHISASSGSIGNWYIGVNDGYLRTATGTYGTYKWEDGAVYTATGYCFVALTPKGVIFVLKSGSDYDTSATIVETSSWISSSGGTITPGSGSFII